MDEGTSDEDYEEEQEEEELPSFSVAPTVLGKKRTREEEKTPKPKEPEFGKWIKKRNKPLTSESETIPPPWKSVAGKSGRKQQEPPPSSKEPEEPPKPSSSEPSWKTKPKKGKTQAAPPPAPRPKHPEKTQYPPNDLPEEDAVPPKPRDLNWRTLLRAIDLRIKPLASHMDPVRTNLYELSKRLPDMKDVSEIYKAVNELYVKVVVNLRDYVANRGEPDNTVEDYLFYVSFLRSLEDVLMKPDSPLISLGRFDETLTRHHLSWWKELAAELLNLRASCFSYFDLVSAMNNDMASVVSMYFQKYRPEA